VTVTVMFSERWVLQIPLLPSRALQRRFGNYGYLGTGTGAYHPVATSQPLRWAAATESQAAGSFLFSSFCLAVSAAFSCKNFHIISPMVSASCSCKNLHTINPMLIRHSSSAKVRSVYKIWKLITKKTVESTRKEVKRNE
jgi:hypothetical protein